MPKAEKLQTEIEESLEILNVIVMQHIYNNQNPVEALGQHVDDINLYT